MTTEMQTTLAVEAALVNAIKALNTAILIGESNGTYGGALAVAHLAVKEAHLAVLSTIS
jgi:hypothetical protein